MPAASAAHPRRAADDLGERTAVWVGPPAFRTPTTVLAASRSPYSRRRSAVAGGTAVELRGGGFAGGTAYSVRFGAKEVAATFDSDGIVRCVTPPSATLAAGEVGVWLSLNGRDEVRNVSAAFVYAAAAAPALVEPILGPVGGGTLVRLGIQPQTPGLIAVAGPTVRCRFAGGANHSATDVPGSFRDEHGLLDRAAVRCETPARGGGGEEIVLVALNGQQFEGGGAGGAHAASFFFYTPPTARPSGRAPGHAPAARASRSAPLVSRCTARARRSSANLGRPRAAAAPPRRQGLCAPRRPLPSTTATRRTSRRTAVHGRSPSLSSSTGSRCTSSPPSPSSSRRSKASRRRRRSRRAASARLFAAPGLCPARRPSTGAPSGPRPRGARRRAAPATTRPRDDRRLGPPRVRRAVGRRRRRARRNRRRLW